MRIHHIALRTRDLPRLEAFYARVLGLVVTRRDGERSVWLRSGDAIVMLELAGQDEPAVPAGTRELVAFAIETEERAERERALADRGIAIEARTDFTLYFRDPDGRRLALSCYCE